MESINYVSAIWRHKFLILLLGILGAAFAWVGTDYQFEPHYIGQYQFTINLASDAQIDPRSADWFTDTIIGWMENPETQEEVDFPYSIHRVTRQTLAITFTNSSDEPLNDYQKEAEKLLQREINNYNTQNNYILKVSNKHFTTWAAVSYQIRNTIFGALLGVVLAIIIALLCTENKHNKKN